MMLFFPPLFLFFLNTPFLNTKKSVISEQADNYNAGEQFRSSIFALLSGETCFLSLSLSLSFSLSYKSILKTREPDGCAIKLVNVAKLIDCASLLEPPCILLFSSALNVPSSHSFYNTLSIFRSIEPTSNQIRFNAFRWLTTPSSSC